jgi:hypothetical protein
MSTLRTAFLVGLALVACAAAPARAQTGQQLFSQWCQGCHGPAGANVNNVLAGKDWTFIRLAMDTRVQMNEVLRPAYDEGTLTDEHLMSIGAYLQTVGGGGATPVRPVVEYFNAAFGHYFVTADDDEIAGLDAGAFDFAFIRTGRAFNAHAAVAAGRVPVCRFFTTPGTFGAKSSHFYTANAAECDGLKLNVAWVYEKIAFYVAVPGGNGACAAGLVPVWRMYNNGQTGAPNHRFTTDALVYHDYTTTKGWSPEGIAFCAPP